MDYKYVIYIVTAEDIDMDFNSISYDEVKNLAIDSIEGDSFSELVNQMVQGINKETLSDQHFYFLTDEQEGIIITK